MLTELRVANFALIDRLSLRLRAGLTVLTGETGAGKSLLVDAIALLIGERPSAELIRTDAEEAVAEGAFALPSDSPVLARLREAGVVAADEAEVLVRRVLSRTGRHRAYVNGNLAPVQLLQSLAGTLVDIHGQHDQQSLLAASSQLDAVDAFGHLTDLRRDYAHRFRDWKEIQQAFDVAVREAEERRRREDLLRFELQEITQASLMPNEEAELSAERQRLSHARRLSETGLGVHEQLYGGDDAVVNRLGVVRLRLKEMADLDPGAADWETECHQMIVQMKDLAGRVQEYAEGLEPNADRLGAIEDRMDLIHRLTRKYGGSVDAVIRRGAELAGDVARLEADDSRIASLRKDVEEARARVVESAQRLSKDRTRAAAKLETRVRDELAALRMGQTRFQIAVRPESGDGIPGPTGSDRIEFQFSANPGEPMRPLAAVASGGELSRVMLAMKTVLADTDRVPVLIFDEVDAGVGGAVAATMGKRLQALAEFHQVFCITHLPQIASQAGTHLVVEKRVAKGRTVTQVRTLDSRGQAEEVARMLAGREITKAVRETASEMIEEAQRKR